MCRKFAYGPQAASEDMERIEFKMKFFKILQVLTSLLFIVTGDYA